MSLEEIKNNYAVNLGYDSFCDILYNEINIEEISECIDEVMKIYAMECLKLASSKLQHVSNRLLITNGNNIIE